MDARAIASANVPVLCIDTCSILDIMRDPTRETVRPHEREAGIELVVAAEAGNLVCLMAEQVAIEFSYHDQSVQDEAKHKLRNLRKQIERINKLSALYGAIGSVDMSHLNDHVLRTRDVVERWLTQLDKITPGSDVPAKAFARLNAGRAPAKRGKDSSKDCLVYETYLEVSTTLRNSGVTTPIVFLSSNTDEYQTESKAMKPEIASDFGLLNINYAPNMSAAKRALGL